MVDYIIENWYIILIVLFILSIPSIIVWLIYKNYQLETFLITYIIIDFIFELENFINYGENWAKPVFIIVLIYVLIIKKRFLYYKKVGVINDHNRQ
jgi:hypothetical protein